MIAKITRGSGFRGSLAYLLREDHRPEIIGGRMAGQDARELTSEFRLGRELRPDVAKPVHHVAIALSPEERSLTDSELARLAEDYLDRMGWDRGRTQYVLIRHRDRDHQHVHVLASRIRLDGTLQPLQYRDFQLSKTVSRKLEKEHRLLPMRERSRGLSRGEEGVLRRGLLPEKMRLRAEIREAARGRPDLDMFVRRLEARGVEVRLNAARTGHVSGISYARRDGQVAVKGSHLGREFTWQGVKDRLGVRREPDTVRRLVARQRQLAIPRKTSRRRESGRRARRGRDRGQVARLAANLVPGGRSAAAAERLARSLSALGRGESREVALRVLGGRSPRAATLARELTGRAGSGLDLALRAAGLIAPKVVAVARALAPELDRGGMERVREISRGWSRGGEDDE